MRIISGKYGRRRFDVPHTFKARPTTDMAKENLFNVLANRVDWPETDALDLFAGTGSIGFEMLSRGARSVTALEMDPQHVAFIRDVADRLGDPAYRVIRQDVLKWLKRLGEEVASGAAGGDRTKYRLIVADPPYDLPQLPQLPYLIREADILAPGGLYVQEHSKAVDFSSLPDYVETRQYGAVHFSIFHRDSDGLSGV